VQDDRRPSDGFDRELARAFQRGADAGMPGDHLDAEVAAAWADGGLDAVARLDADAHLAECLACQALVATLARVTPAPPEPVSFWRWLRQPWLVPVMAAAAAVAIYVAVPDAPVEAPERDSTLATRETRPDVPPGGAASNTFSPTPTEAAPASAPAAPPSVSAPADQARDRRVPATPPPATPVERRAVEPAPALPPAPEQVEAPAPRQEAIADRAGTIEAERKAAVATVPPAVNERQDVRVEAAPATAAPALARAPLAGTGAAAISARGGQALQIVAADGNARWRVTAARLEFAPRAGAPWTPAVLPTDASLLTTGSAPAGTICWMAGRDGLVVVSTDGRRFVRTTVPAAADIVRVVADGARTAVVTTGDGRRFQTADQGATWSALLP
jgi:hypothetical protein